MVIEIESNKENMPVTDRTTAKKGKKTATKPKERKQKGIPSVDDVELDFEKDDKVPVYDTCDEIRRKITLHLKKPGVTQAAFLRCASASFHLVPRKLSSAQLSSYRSKRGPCEGNTSGIFYGAYVYFEKMRIKEGKPKSKKREEMEKIHKKHGGLDTKALQGNVFCLENERPSIDGYGRLVITGPRGSRIVD